MDDSVGNIIDMAAKKAGLASKQKAAPTEWMKRLLTTGGDNPSPLPTVSNAMILLANDPAVAGMVAYNAFTSQPLIMRSPPPSEEGDPELPGPYPRPWDETDVTLTHAYLQRLHCSRLSREAVEHAMVAEAKIRQFHPIRDWLDELRWDGTPRIDFWLVNAFDCENTPLHTAAGAKFLIAAVRRVRQPGCKFDELLVLEGAQGIGKSRALKALFSPAYFSDAIPADLTSKDAAMALLGVWGLEFGEIEHLIRAEVETIKAFLSRSVDRYRPPYGKSYVERPRQGVLVGTTNADDYLRDSTGNRRIWPVRCKTADPNWIEVNRDQLWAEAAVREAGGEAIWLDNENTRLASAEAAAHRMAEDVWHPTVEAWLSGRNDVLISDVLEHALFMSKDKMNKSAEMRVGSILKVMGWARVLIRDTRNGGKPTRVWRNQP